MNYIEAQRKVQERAKAYTHQTFAGALKGSASGTALLLPDVSPIEHEMGVKVRSKNLIPYPWETGTLNNGSVNINGVEITDNGDGSLTFNGTCASGGIFNFDLSMNTPIEAGDYTMSFNVSYASEEHTELNANLILFYLRFEDGTEKNFYNGNLATKALPEGTITRMWLWVQGGGAVYDNVTIKPQLEKGTTATPFTPYVSDLSAVSLKRQGAQLIPYPYAKADGEYISNGMTVVINGEGDISVSGTPTGIAQITLYEGEPLVKSGTCVLSDGKGAVNADITLELYTKNHAYIAGLSTKNGDAIYDAENYPTVGYWTIRSRRTANNTKASGTLKPMLNVGTTAMPFTPYIEPTTYAVSADGTVEGVTPIYPNTTLLTDTSGVVVECEYNRDLNKAFEELTQAIISLGGNI